MATQGPWATPIIQLAHWKKVDGVDNNLTDLERQRLAAQLLGDLPLGDIPKSEAPKGEYHKMCDSVHEPKGWGGGGRGRA